MLTYLTAGRRYRSGKDHIMASVTTDIHDDGATAPTMDKLAQRWSAGAPVANLSPPARPGSDARSGAGRAGGDAPGGTAAHFRRAFLRLIQMANGAQPRPARGRNRLTARQDSPSARSRGFSGRARPRLHPRAAPDGCREIACQRQTPRTIAIWPVRAWEMSLPRDMPKSPVRACQGAEFAHQACA